jgi:hypothetical protein
MAKITEVRSSSRKESCGDEKSRRQLFERRVRDFLDAVEHIGTHPLLVWGPGGGDAAEALIKAVAQHKQGSQAWKERSQGER